MTAEMTAGTTAEMMAETMAEMMAAMTDVAWVGSSAGSKAASWVDSMVGDSDKRMAVSSADPSVAMWGECSAANWVVETDGRSVASSADLMV